MSARSSTRRSSRAAAAAAAAVLALLALALLALALVAPAEVAAKKRPLVHDLPLPRGARSLDTDLFESSHSFRKTVDFYARTLKRRGLPHQAVPVYRFRGTAVARFISKDPGSLWRAVHVFKNRGRTRIYIVPRGAKPLDGAAGAR